MVRDVRVLEQPHEEHRQHGLQPVELQQGRRQIVQHVNRLVRLVESPDWSMYILQLNLNKVNINEL